jgi:hypothetical protein
MLAVCCTSAQKRIKIHECEFLYLTNCIKGPIIVVSAQDALFYRDFTKDIRGFYKYRKKTALAGGLVEPGRPLFFVPLLSRFALAMQPFLFSAFPSVSAGQGTDHSPPPAPAT